MRLFAQALISKQTQLMLFWKLEGREVKEGEGTRYLRPCSLQLGLLCPKDPVLGFYLGTPPFFSFKANFEK